MFNTYYIYKILLHIMEHFFIYKKNHQTVTFSPFNKLLFNGVFIYKYLLMAFAYIDNFFTSPSALYPIFIH